MGLNAGVGQGQKIGEGIAIRADLLAAQDFASRVGVIDMACPITKKRRRENPYF